MDQLMFFKNRIINRNLRFAVGLHNVPVYKDICCEENGLEKSIKALLSFLKLIKNEESDETLLYYGLKRKKQDGTLYNTYISKFKLYLVVSYNSQIYLSDITSFYNEDRPREGYVYKKFGKAVYEMISYPNIRNIRIEITNFTRNHRTSVLNYKFIVNDNSTSNLDFIVKLVKVYRLGVYFRKRMPYFCLHTYCIFHDEFRFEDYFEIIKSHLELRDDENISKEDAIINFKNQYPEIQNILERYILSIL